MRKDCPRRIPEALLLEDRFTAEKTTQICRETGLPEKDLEKLRRDLVGAACFYWMHKSVLDARTSEVREDCRRAAKALTAAAQQLEHMNDRSRLTAWLAVLEIARRHGEEWFGPPEPGEVRNDGLEVAQRAAINFFPDIRGVYRLEEIFTTVAKNLIADRTGRGRDEALDRYILDLADIYCDASGESPRTKFTYDSENKVYWGPFFTFVEGNLNLLPLGRNLGNATLATIVRRALRESGRYPRPERKAGRKGKPVQGRP